MKNTNYGNIKGEEAANRHGAKSGFLVKNPRADNTTSTNPSIANFSSNYLSISDSNSSQLLEKLGVTVHKNAPDKKIHITNIPDAEYVDESGNIPEMSMTSSSTGLIKKIAMQLIVTRDLLPTIGEDTSWFTPVLNDMIAKSLSGGLTAQLIDQLEGLDPETGYEASTPDVSLTHSICVAEELKLKTVAEDSSLKWLVASDVNANLKNTVIDSGSARFLSQFNQMAGIDLVSSSRLQTGRAILGDFSKIIIREPKDIDIMVDPYKFAATGKTVIRAMGLYAIDIPHTTDFQLYENIALS